MASQTLGLDSNVDTPMLPVAVSGNKRLASSQPEPSVQPPAVIITEEQFSAMFTKFNAMMEAHTRPIFEELRKLREAHNSTLERISSLEATCEELADNMDAYHANAELTRARVDDIEVRLGGFGSTVEELDRRSRANNMIIHNVPESNTQQAKELLLNGSEPLDIGLLSLERMGAPRASPTAKPRPLRATFVSRSARGAAFKRSAAFRRIGATLREDLTPAQRAEKAARAPQVAALRGDGYTVFWRETTLYKLRDGSAPVIVPPLRSQTHRASTPAGPPAAPGGDVPPAATGGRSSRSRGGRAPPAASGGARPRLPAAATAAAASQGAPLPNVPAAGLESSTTHTLPSA